jgi:peptidoglycan/LPS O-acetylase OafA/YrhL
MHPPLRSFLAVFLGYLVMAIVVVLLTVVAVQTMHLKSGQPTPGYLAVNVVYSLLAAAVGGWVTGRLGRPLSLQHGYALAAVMVVMGVLSYRHYTGSQPRWYQGVLVVLPAGCALVAAGLAGKNPHKP